MVDLKYIGHSAFEIRKDDKAVLIDPLVSVNEKYNWHEAPITDILLTHAHGDHLGEAIEIAKEKDIEITAVFELAGYCKEQGVKAKSVGLGSWLNYSWGRAVYLPAFHSSSTPDGVYGGMPCGYILEIEGKTIYHAGDTGLNSEMKMIGEVYEPDIAMLPIGGKYTMDIEHAVKAAEWLGASEIIPMHYNTFDAISVDINDFERQIREIGKFPRIMGINENK